MGLTTDIKICEVCGKKSYYIYDSRKLREENLCLNEECGYYYINFDKKTGKKLTNQSLFKHYDALSEFAEIEFRKAFAIPQKSNINANYFWFNGDAFTMPSSLGFVKDSLVLHYNQQEIASYRDAPVILSIPLDKVKGFMK